MTYDIILNVEKSGIKPRIKVSQYDKTLPQIRATLYSNNQAFNIPSGSTVYISGTKKDNTGFKYECTYSNNEITADITEQMTAFSGDVEVEFTIESSGSRKGTENFILEVEKAALEDDVVISETDIPAIQRLSQPASTTQLGVIKVDGTSVTIDEDGTLHSSGGGGTSDYNYLVNKPQIAGVTLFGNKSLNDLGIAAASDIPNELADLSDDSTHRLVTDAEKSTWDGKSVVSVTQIKSSGEKIATINVNGTDTDLYASAGGGGGGAVDSVNGMTGDVVLDLDDIHDTAISSPTDGQTLVYYATSGKWVNGNIPIPIDLSDLSDVDTSGVTDGQILKYNATSGKFLPSNESGGGTTDYTDLTNKPSINGVTLSGNKTSANLGIFAPTIASPTSGQVIKYDGNKWVNSSVSGGNNPNLLDNSHFQINQKGFTSGRCGNYVTTTMFDRWNASYSGGADSDGIITYNSDNSVTLSPNFTTGRAGNIAIVQKIDRKMVDTLTNIDVCISAYLNDYSIKVVKVFNIADGTVSSQWEEIGDNYQVGLYLDARETDSYRVNLLIGRIDTSMVPSASGIKVNYMKVELGSTSTIEKDYLPNYTEELLKCQRYFYPLGGKGYNAMVSALQQTRQWFTITLPTEMRAVPTLSGSLVSEGINGSTRVEDTVTSSNITVTKTQDIEFNFTTSNNFNLCSSARVSFLSGSYLSAEL